MFLSRRTNTDEPGLLNVALNGIILLATIEIIRLNVERVRSGHEQVKLLEEINNKLSKENGNA